MAICLVRCCGLLAVLAAVTPSAQAQSTIGPKRYFQCHIAAKQATLTGLEERAALLAKGASAAELAAAGERSQLRVDLAFQNCGADATTLAAYAYQQSELNADWLARSPKTKARLDELSLQIAVLSRAVDRGIARPATANATVRARGAPK